MDKITPPPMPEPFIGKLGNFASTPLYSAPQLEARDAQWLAIVKEAMEAEREACAKVCTSKAVEYDAADWYIGDRQHGKVVAANSCAAAIRSRSTT